MSEVNIRKIIGQNPDIQNLKFFYHCEFTRKHPVDGETNQFSFEFVGGFNVLLSLQQLLVDSPVFFPFFLESFSCQLFDELPF